jgi:hypothetical protein
MKQNTQTPTKHDQALQVLVNAVQVANKRGAYELQESKAIAEAVEVFTNPTDQEDQRKEMEVER